MKNGHILVKVDIPLYMVKVINDRHILVAGGGGSANTGVRNAVEIYELLPCFNYRGAIRVTGGGGGSSKKTPCTVKVLQRYYTDNRAIMSGVVFRDGRQLILVGGGINGECIFYHVKPTIQEIHRSNGYMSNDAHRDSFSALNKVRRRRTSSSGSTDSIRDSHFINNLKTTQEEETEEPFVDGQSDVKSNHVNHIVESRLNGTEIAVSYELEKLTSFVADFQSNSKTDEPFVKVIRYNPVSSVLVTGGADGHIRVWRYPEATKLNDIFAHTDEIDDLDINEAGTLIVSVSRDGHAYVWNASDGSKSLELECQLPVIKNSTKLLKYLIRACRFGHSSGSSYKLYTIHNPAVREKPPHHAFICKWSKNFTIDSIASLGPIVASSMTISEDGNYIGIGTQDGGVDIYEASVLQRIYTAPRAHNIFVTGLEFLPVCSESKRLTGDSDCSLISISVDRRIVLHNINRRKSIGFFTFIFTYLLSLFCIYVIFIGLIDL